MGDRCRLGKLRRERHVIPEDIKAEHPAPQRVRGHQRPLGNHQPDQNHHRPHPGTTELCCLLRRLRNGRSAPSDPAVHTRQHHPQQPGQPPKPKQTHHPEQFSRDDYRTSSQHDIRHYAIDAHQRTEPAPHQSSRPSRRAEEQPDTQDAQQGRRNAHGAHQGWARLATARPMNISVITPAGCDRPRYGSESDALLAVDSLCLRRSRAIPARERNNRSRGPHPRRDASREERTPARRSPPRPYPSAHDYYKVAAAGPTTEASASVHAIAQAGAARDGASLTAPDSSEDGRNTVAWRPPPAVESTRCQRRWRLARQAPR